MATKDHLSWDDKKIDNEIKRIREMISNKETSLEETMKELRQYKKDNRRWDSKINKWVDKSTGEVWKDDLNDQLELARGRRNIKDFGVKDPYQTIEYLKSLKDYNKHIHFKTDGNVATLGLQRRTYNQKVAASLEDDEYAVSDDGTTKYAAEFDDKLNRKKQNLDSLYNNSLYLVERKANLNKKIKEKSEIDKDKKIELTRQEQLRKQLATQREIDEQFNRSKYLDVSPGGTLGIRENVKTGIPVTEGLGKLLGINYGKTDGG